MSANLARKANRAEALAFAPARQTVAERLTLTLTALAILASIAAFVNLQQNIQPQANPDQALQANFAKSQLYYAIYASQILFSVSAALVALLFTDFRTIDRGYPLRLMLLLGSALLMTARSYTLSDLLSTKIVDATGPFPYILSLLVFVGARRSNWFFLRKFIVIVAVLFSALALLGMTGLQTFSRQEAAVSLQGTLNALYWPASWIALTDYPQTSFWRRLRFGPILIYALGSLFTQTRLNFILIFALVGVYIYLQRKRKMPQGAGWVLGVTLVIWVALFTSVFLRSSRSFERLESVAAAFSSRLDEDTRTNQLVSFAQNVEPQELLLGRGSFATWYWNGDYGGGTDVGYLTVLFYGGVPLLVSYILTNVMPCVTVLRKHAADWQLTAGGVVLLWGIRMFSSDYPGADLGYYFVLFCVGACISRDPSDQGRRRVPMSSLH